MDSAFHQVTSINSNVMTKVEESSASGRKRRGGGKRRMKKKRTSNINKQYSSLKFC